MKIISFKYTKDCGTASNRTLAVTVSPNTMYEGVDMSELEPENMALFQEEMDKAYTQYLTEIASIKDKYDLNHNYRRFDPKKMTDVVVEVV